MLVHYDAGLALSLLTMVASCLLLQWFFRKKLSRDQYFYMRDLSLMGALILLALWSGSPQICALIASAMLALLIGTMEQLHPDQGWFFLIPLPGLFFALTGATISFFAAPDGGYLYLTSFQSLVITTLWMTLFPVLFQRLDQVPGLAGHLLSVILSLMLVVTSLSEQELGEGFFMALGSLLLVGAYWSRLGHHYRHLECALTSVWGVVVAGVSILGVSKGIAITALMVVPLGFYSVPLVEISLGLVSQTVLRRPPVSMPYLYGKVLERGVDHPAAVRLVTTICLLVGATVAFVQLGPSSSPLRAFGFMSALALAALLWTLWGGKSDTQPQRSLWGVKIDGISMNYALSKAMAWLRSPRPEFRMVVTVNALALCHARRDSEFRHIARDADLTLPDGKGLFWALKVLGIPAVERVAGIDFMDRLCRLAAVDDLPVYLLGGRPGVAQEAAKQLQSLHRGLAVAGADDGYFDPRHSHQIAQRIRCSGARILFVALGQPKQEKWLRDHSQDLEGILSVGVGGSFDVYAGRLKRAPQAWQDLGCEWLYRLLQEPRRLRKDLELFAFLWFVVREKLKIFPWKEPQ